MDMKTYYNSTTEEWYNEGQSITRRIENGVFMGIPTVEQLTEWGFTEYVEPTPTAEQLLTKAKIEKIKQIEAYDKSDSVNEFYYNEIPMWLDKATRDGLHLRLLAEQAAGKENTTLWFETQSFEIPIANAFQLLYAIEVYASACYDKTAAHKAAVEALGSVEAVNAYDYTIGYPEKLNI